MKQKTLGFLFVIVAVATFYLFTQSTPREAGMLLVNGTIYTLDPDNTVAQAVAIRGDRIVSVGRTDEMKRRYHADTVIDLQGATVMPGFIDGHGHVLNEGSRIHNLDVTGATSPEQVAKMVARRVQELQPGQWLIGRGWDQNLWPVKEFPKHDILDKVAASLPVVLRRIDGHAMWVNRKTMELAGINRDTRDPDGGKIYRDTKGNPTGVLVDNAMDLVNKVAPELTDEEIEQRLKLSLDECAQLGLTEVHDMGVDLQTIHAYKKLIDRGQCPVRVYAAINDPGETWNYYLQHGVEIGYGNGMLTVRAFKLYIDGALGSRGAAMLDSYSDDPGNRGLTVTAESDIEKNCRQALEHGFQVCTHAIGDRGNFVVLNEYEKVLKTMSPNAPSPRWRVEHAQVLQQSDLPRFAQLGILPSMQPTHATSDMYWAEGRLGLERVKRAYAWRSILQTGSIIIAGSDFPIEGVNPLWGFYAAITRSDRSGYPQDGWYPDQKMTREEAARAFTQWAAFGAFQEEVKGTIEPGKWADLTVFSRDIMQVSPMDVLKTDVEMTLVGGKIVYCRPVQVAP
ncbi:MAG: amidohydrolase [Bacteroidota bacterium]|jgi:predicted amidohydrolase YtcJ